MKSPSFYLTNYFERFDAAPPRIQPSPPDRLAFVVVIPCYNEPDLITTLQSLSHCTPPTLPGEVIIHINCTSDAPPTVKQRNWATYKETQEWIHHHPQEQLHFHVIYSDDLTPKDAGPGLARKIGMDEALHRFIAADQPEGAIISLDADCQVAPNYFSVLEKEFIFQPQLNGCNIYFEHPLSSSLKKEVRQAITNYELFLRYYKQALAYAGFPYAYHTIGSCMGVKAPVYAKQGGMNKNKGGEDFYFLHKIFPLGDFVEITGTTVYPKARLSQRVPYGTGKAITEWVEKDKKTYYTYPLQQFKDLRSLFSHVTPLHHQTPQQLHQFLNTLTPALQAFLKKQNFISRIQEIQANTAHPQTFEQRFFQWFNGMKVLKYCYFGQEEYYSLSSLQKESAHLLQVFTALSPSTNTPQNLLTHYRQLEKDETLVK